MGQRLGLRFTICIMMQTKMSQIAAQTTASHTSITVLIVIIPVTTPYNHLTHHFLDVSYLYCTPCWIVSTIIASTR